MPVSLVMAPPLLGSSVRADGGDHTGRVSPATGQLDPFVDGRRLGSPVVPQGVAGTSQTRNTGYRAKLSGQRPGSYRPVTGLPRGERRPEPRTPSLHPVQFPVHE